MTEAERMAAETWRHTVLRSGVPIPDVKQGTIRIFGVWVVRPFDGIGTIVDAEAVEERRILRFTTGDTVTVWDPEDAVIDPGTFWIKRASRVRLEIARPPGGDAGHGLVEYRVEGGLVRLEPSTSTASAPSLEWAAMELA